MNDFYTNDFDRDGFAPDDDREPELSDEQRDLDAEADRFEYLTAPSLRYLFVEQPDGSFTCEPRLCTTGRLPFDTEGA